MLGIEDYGSDSDSGEQVAQKPQPSTSKGTKPARAPKKITISLPSISSAKDDEDKDTEAEARPAKKRKTGAGSSSLLSMLPAPKEKNPVPQPQRVLGAGSGPGLNFQAAPRTQTASPPKPSVDDENFGGDSVEAALDIEEPEFSSALFRPTSLGKGKKNISVEETSIGRPRPPQPQPSAAPPVDFFSLSKTAQLSSYWLSDIQSVRFHQNICFNF